MYLILIVFIVEFRLEERFNRIHAKGSNNHVIQVHRRILEPKLPARVPLEIVLEQSNPPTVKGISLIYNKEENSGIRKLEDRIDIKNFPNSNCPITNDINDTSNENELTIRSSDIIVTPSTFLGKIYNEVSLIERSKSLSNADTDANAPQNTNKTDSKKHESKSTPSVKKLLDNQNKMTEDFRKLTVNPVVIKTRPTTPCV